MKKSLIALAVASAFAAPAAMADVTISGAIATGLLISDSSGSNSVSKNQLASNYSNMNITSVDDIGNGMKVMFNYQWNVAVQALDNNPTNRDSYLGIGGTWGNLKYGTNENVYERMQYSSDFLDGALGPGGNLMILSTPGANTAFEVGQSDCDAANGGTGCVGFYRRTDHTIWYESPNFNGFSFEVDYTLSAFKTTTTDPKVLSIGGKYAPEGMPFFIDVAYEKHDDMFGLSKIASAYGGGYDGETSSSDTGMQVGGGYTFGNFQINARWEQLKYEATGRADGVNEYKRAAYFIGGKANLPTGYVAAQIGIAQDGKTNLGDETDTGATMYGIGYFHNLSKQSQLQAIYAKTNNKDNATYTQAGATSTNPGDDHQAIYFGIKHTF